MDPPAVTNNVVVQRKTDMAAVIAATMTDQATADETNGARGCDAVLNFATSVPSAKRAAKLWKERRASSRNTTDIKPSTADAGQQSHVAGQQFRFVRQPVRCGN